ncbi:hypothetical protein [Streptomyces uncialis]|uniref:Secreted protein n=1 Tax=Streptomyces uncialis TaxID=1048205 RepID=A0A1Q4VDN4_9ACTN|nr:hypothetical protein [Streptomyces uncialis]MCX4660863.1 hypothetical protein [Streptomyces uncialis]OKH95909.1 hypothetical protein AB852_04080 [Streptomyces uncialis]WTE12511.1 hypothetical protein OG924_21010 [Streptomyces uncialis]
MTRATKLLVVAVLTTGTALGTAAAASAADNHATGGQNRLVKPLDNHATHLGPLDNHATGAH